jgi:hypothetical protein
MSFITIEHSNPGKVTKRMSGWSDIFRSNLIIETAKQTLDERYKQMYAAAPHISGKLRNSIAVTSGEDFAHISVGVYYAVYVSRGQSPRGSRVPNTFWTNNVAGLSMQIIVNVRDLFASRW